MPKSWRERWLDWRNYESDSFSCNLYSVVTLDCLSNTNHIHGDSEHESKEVEVPPDPFTHYLCIKPFPMRVQFLHMGQKERVVMQKLGFLLLELVHDIDSDVIEHLTLKSHSKCRKRH
jgi:hypothetical protein